MSLTTAFSRAVPHTRTSLFDILLSLDALRRQRRQLAALDNHALADLGLTRSQAQTEAARPVWDAPAIWKQ
ncbi:DUF1127 domain-containing protein [Puniceibacterium sp. IMCC21224]|uniref:DUF1127 domain-containing protein n=1 Tax=Puniceibacterium sp. IMCC21224 TaxID=1618204 RepID=UPI00064E131C|nr:DUF1127 domain-containing protein [Puniceibacterium sp. IMCC21224]KMK67840.1 hypothetical protein IMCC21224_112716 [Puniceibacterium sp. IMCC21224]